jgi:hypothetical protein
MLPIYFVLNSVDVGVLHEFVAGDVMIHCTVSRFRNEILVGGVPLCGTSTVN